MTDIKVEQCDRDAAADWNIECKHCSEYEGDYEADLAEAFARHRIAAQSCGELAERDSMIAGLTAERDEARTQYAAAQAAMVEADRRGQAYVGFWREDAQCIVEPLQPHLPQPAPDPKPGEIWSYKGKDYFIIRDLRQALIQHEDEWVPGVAYRCEPGNGLTFCRALPDFLAKFTRITEKKS